MIEIIILTFLILSCFIKNKNVNQISMTICVYFLFRWLTDYRKCSISYFEIKIRGISKEEGFIYQFLDPLFNYNKSKFRFIIYFALVMIMLINNNNLKNITTY